MKPALSGELAQWASGLTIDQIPDAVIDDAKLRILDILGVTIAACPTEAARIARDSAVAIGSGNSRVLGFGDRVAPAAAAIANGVMAHIHDYDDTHSDARIHISNPIVTTVLSLGYARNISGADALLALVVGAELTARIGMIAPAEFHVQGFHTTGVIAAVGSAYGAAKIMSLSWQETQNAIGIVCSQASGISECFSDGTWTKRLHPGWAAHCGISAATLASFGFTGPAKGLEGARGLFNTHIGRADHRYEVATEQLGQTWHSPRSSFKPYACGHVIHGFIDAVLNLQKVHGVTADQVKRITCPTAKWMMPLVAEPRDLKLRPDDEAFAKISLYFSVAAALVNRGLDLETFEHDRLDHPGTLELADKIYCTVDADAAPNAYKGWVIVETNDGRTLEQIVPHSLGSDANPMSAADLARKFHNNLAFGGMPDITGRAMTMIEELHGSATIRDLVDLCCRA
jgi:2-methylcitrate dehydratase PrpD